MNYCIPKMIEDLKAGISKKEVSTYMYGMPQDLGELQLPMIIVAPDSTQIEPRATGLIVQDTDVIEVILAKSYKTTTYQNASQAGDVEFLTRIMRGKDANNDLFAGSIVSILQKNMKSYGINQPTMAINWNDTRFEKEGIIAATLTITQNTLSDQIIN